MNWNNFIIGAVLFTFALVAGITPIAELTQNYNVDDDGRFNTTLNKFEDLANITAQQSAVAQQGTIETADFYTSLGKNSLTGAKLFFSMPSIITAMLFEMMGILSMPAWVLSLATFILTFSLFTLFMYLWFKVKVEDN